MERKFSPLYRYLLHIDESKRICEGFTVRMFDKINKCNYKDTETAFSLDKVINNDMINRYNISMNCTYFITNCGQHPAAHWHFTYLEYKDLVLETANILKISEFLECSACVDIVCLWRCLNIFSFICLKLVNK